jgi:hypothetical protein
MSKTLPKPYILRAGLEPK